MCVYVYDAYVVCVVVCLCVMYVYDMRCVWCVYVHDVYVCVWRGCMWCEGCVCGIYVVRCVCI